MLLVTTFVVNYTVSHVGNVQREAVSQLCDLSRGFSLGQDNDTSKVSATPPRHPNSHVVEEGKGTRDAYSIS